MFNRIRVVTMLMMVQGGAHCYSLFPVVCCFLHYSITSKVLLFLTNYVSNKANSRRHGT